MGREFLEQTMQASTLAAVDFYFGDLRILLGQDVPGSVMEIRQMVHSTHPAGLPFFGLD